MNSTPFRYVISSALSFGVDNLIYYLLFSLVGSVPAQIIARVISSFFNFNLNRSFVFKSNDGYLKSLAKYYCLCVPQLAVSTVLVKIVTDRLSVTAPLLATGIKIAIDAVLFCISFLIQNKWVFKKKADSDDAESD